MKLLANTLMSDLARETGIWHDQATPAININKSFRTIAKTKAAY